MNKKAIVILGAIFLLIVGTLGFLVYSRYSGSGGEAEKSDGESVDNTGSDAGDTASTGGADNTSTTTPPVLEKFIKLTSNEQVVSPVLFYNGNGVTYLNGNGELMKADFETLENGQISLTRTRNLNIEAKSGIVKILWPKNGDDFIAEVARGGSRTFSYFNFSTGTYIDLPEQVKAVEWLPSGDRILFIWVENGADGSEKATLNIAKADTTGYQEIAELWESDDALYLSPDGLNVLLHRTLNNGSVNKIIQTALDGKIWKDLAKEGYNYGVLWSPDSQKFLFSKRERAGRNYQLWFYDLYTGEVKNLGVYGAPQKAVWASDSRTVYFAAPQDSAEIIDPANLESASGVLTADAFYKIDTMSLEKTENKPESLSIDGRDLFLNPAEDKLFFRNAQDGGLYYFDLTK